MFSIVSGRLLTRLASNQLMQMAARRSLFRVSAGDGFREMGPWPKTKEERIRAAKKYNLIPEDYKPFDEDEGWGDYPDLPAIGDYNKDRYDDFDDVYDLRHHGEPMHIQWDIYRWHCIDPLEHEKPDEPLWKKLAIFFGFFGSIPLAYFTIQYYDIRGNRNWKQSSHIEHGLLYDFPPSKVDPVYGGHH